MATYEYQQLEKEFLRYVEQIHAEHDFALDYRALAVRLGVKVRQGKRDMHVVAPDGQSIVVIEPKQAAARLRFTGLHELSHHLAHFGRDGMFREELDTLYGADRKMRIEVEEALCYKAAALLLMPTTVTQNVLRDTGHTPKGVLDLADETGASLAAAMRRLVWLHEIPVHALLLSTNGYVHDAIAHSGRRADYWTGQDFTVSINHELRRSPFRHRAEETFEAHVPFKSIQLTTS